MLKKGARVIDLGAAPGGWSQVAAKRVGAPSRGRVVAIDVLPMDPIAGVDFAQLDFLDPGAPDKLKAMLGGPADVVLSDMAANATGHAKTDHLKIMALVEAAADFAREVLAPGGTFLAKVLQGGTEAALLAALKRDFKSVKHVKPAASRSDSAELYLLATGLPRLARKTFAVVPDVAETRFAVMCRNVDLAPSLLGGADRAPIALMALRRVRRFLVLVVVAHGQSAITHVARDRLARLSRWRQLRAVNLLIVAARGCLFERLVLRLFLRLGGLFSCLNLRHLFLRRSVCISGSVVLSRPASACHPQHQCAPAAAAYRSILH